MELDLKNDFGFTNPETTIQAVENPKELRNRLDELKQTLWPFLDNLMRNPEKDIHWPDRDVKIGEFKKKLSDIIDGTE